LIKEIKMTDKIEKPPVLKMTNARIGKKNFSGRPDNFNPDGGVRTFLLLIDDPELAEELTAQGWNIKEHKNVEPGEEPGWYLPVKVGYRGYYPPAVYLVTERKGEKVKTPLTEQSISTLDTFRIKSVDIVVNPSPYDVRGQVGIKAYVQRMWVEIFQDDLDQKWADVDTV
jgi:hypothetical protein